MVQRGVFIVTFQSWVWIVFGFCEPLNSQTYTYTYTKPNWTVTVRGFHWRLQCSEGVQNDLQWIFKVLYYSAPSQAILPNDMSLPQSHLLPGKSPSVEYLTRGHHLLLSLSGRLHNITYHIHCIIGSIQDPTFKFKLDNSMSQCLGCIVDSISAPPPFLWIKMYKGVHFWHLEGFFPNWHFEGVFANWHFAFQLTCNIYLQTMFGSGCLSEQHKCADIWNFKLLCIWILELVMVNGLPLASSLQDGDQRWSWSQIIKDLDDQGSLCQKLWWFMDSWIPRSILMIIVFGKVTPDRPSSWWSPSWKELASDNPLTITNSSIQIQRSLKFQMSAHLCCSERHPDPNMVCM